MIPNVIPEQCYKVEGVGNVCKSCYQLEGTKHMAGCLRGMKQADAIVNHYYRRITPLQETALVDLIVSHGSVTIDQVVELDTCYASKIRVAVANRRFWIQPNGFIERVIEDVQPDEPEHPESCMCDECVGDPGVDGLSAPCWFMNQHDYNDLKEGLARDNDYLHRSYSDPFPLGPALEHGQTAGLQDGDFRLTEAAHKRREEALSLIMTGSVGKPITALDEHAVLLTQPQRSVLMTSILPVSVEPKSGEYCSICKQHHD